MSEEPLEHDKRRAAEAACRENDVKKLQKIIGERNPNLRLLTKSWNPSFADIAAKAGSLEVLQFLVRIGCHINPPPTTLEVKEWPHVERREENVFKCVVTVVGDPLTKAAQFGHIHVVEWLVKVAGVEPTTEALGEASSRGHSKIVHFLLQRGCDPNPKEDIRSPLHRACFSGRTECAKLLVKHGAFINGKDGGGMTPLMFAVKFGTEELVAFLLAHGADISVKDKFGKTVLDDCSEERRLWLLGCGPPALMHLAGHAIAAHGMDYSSLPPYLRVFMKGIIGSKYA